MKIYKTVLVLLGTLSLLIGIIGILVPGLPTTPFLLLTTALYVRSSDKLYKKLIENKYIGSYIVEYQTKKGISKKTKLSAVIIIWITILISCVIYPIQLFSKLIILLLGLVGSGIVIFIVPTAIGSDE